jgi:hypothetical protein
MAQEISHADTSSEDYKKSAGCCAGSSTNNSLTGQAFSEEYQLTEFVTRFSKRRLQISMLLVLGCFFVDRQEVTLGFSSSSSTLAATSEVKSQQLHENENEEQGVLGSFLLPERSNMRYPEYGNMTAAEKVASEYVVRKVTDYNPLANCLVTSQVRIIQKSSQWILQSIDTNGNNKTVGGDEFYVTYTDNNPPRKGDHTAAALIQDLENGLYALTFKTTPMYPNPKALTGVGTLNVHFLYSCNIGLAHQPVKDKWKSGGATQIHHTKSNVSQPPILTFRPPSGVDISTFDLVVSFEDSLMQSFVSLSLERKNIGNKAYHHGKSFLKDYPQTELYSGSLSRVLQKLYRWHGAQLNSRTNVALLLGSSALEIIHPETTHAPGFSDHLDTCRRFVLSVQGGYPNVTVIWKAPAAIVRTDDLLSFRCEMRWSIKLC